MTLGSEFDTIRRYFAPLSAGFPGAFGLANDAATWCPSEGCDAVITTDCMVAGVHFLTDDPPQSVAAKILAVNLSDIAAMGARPVAYTLAAAWPKQTDEAWIADFAAGLGEAQTGAGVVLIGGDTVSTPGPMVLTITAIGEIHTGKALTRSGSAEGDDVYVTGTIGDAALGLLVLNGSLAPGSDADKDYLIGRYRTPTARSGVGAGLAGLASAALDVSDGLVQDLGHLARESGVEIAVNRDELPVSPAARRALDRDAAHWDLVFGGGDDYELAFTATPGSAAAIDALAVSSGTRITKIGTVAAATAEENPGVIILDGDGNKISVARAGYRHF